MNTHLVTVINRDGTRETLCVKSSGGRGDLARRIGKDLRDSKVVGIQHNEGFFIAINPISISVV